MGKKFKSLINPYDKFILCYNDTVLINEIPFEPDELFNFLCNYAKGYIKNEGRFNKIR